MRSEGTGPDCVALEGHELAPSFGASAWRFLLTLRHMRHLCFLPEILGRRRVGRERETEREMDAGCRRDESQGDVQGK